MRAENTNRRPQKPLFTSEQIFAELTNQGVQSIKGETGTYLLYKNLCLVYYSGNSVITPQILLDLGFDLKSMNKRQILCGEFKIKSAFNLLDLFTGKLRIELNSAVTNVI
jgi:hypothetical protein